jgi:hypothetical protein
MEENELELRRRTIDVITSYTEWQYIIEFTKRREYATTTLCLPAPIEDGKKLSRRRIAGARPKDLSHVAPIRTRRVTRRLFTHTLDALTVSARIEETFLPELKHHQRGRVAAFWCVEDYHDKDAHAALFVGHLKCQKGDIDWESVFLHAANTAGLTVGRITAWNRQDEGNRLARYLSKSIDPSRFANPDLLLASSSGTWGMCGILPQFFKEH